MTSLTELACAMPTCCPSECSSALDRELEAICSAYMRARARAAEVKVEIEVLVARLRSIEAKRISTGPCHEPLCARCGGAA